MFTNLEILDYKILSNMNIGYLEKEVKELLLEGGWSLGEFRTEVTGTYNIYHFQTLVKYKDPNNRTFPAITI